MKKGKAFRQKDLQVDKNHIRLQRARETFPSIQFLPPPPPSREKCIICFIMITNRDGIISNPTGKIASINLFYTVVPLKPWLSL